MPENNENEEEQKVENQDHPVDQKNIAALVKTEEA